MLIKGHLSPHELVRLSIEELATDSQKQESLLAKDYTLNKSRSDYYKINRNDILLANGINPSTGGEFTCRRCRKDKTTHYALQTRSGDEPMTVFVTCLTCNFRWRTS